VPPNPKHRLDLGHPARYRDGDGDMAGRDAGVNAYAPERGCVPGGVAWPAEEAGHGRVWARHGERPMRVLCLLSCANRPREESLSRRARG
jgi:hypothetical protein